MTTTTKEDNIMKHQKYNLTHDEELMLAKENMETFIILSKEKANIDEEKESLSYELISDKPDKKGRFRFKVIFTDGLVKVSTKVSMPSILFKEDLLEDDIFVQVDGEEKPLSESLISRESLFVEDKIRVIKKGREKLNNIYHCISEGIDDPELLADELAVMDLVFIMFWYGDNEQSCSVRIHEYMKGYNRARNLI